MANTGNTQQQINYGASANDGQGDPLRTAFIKTDDNFDNIWLAGPVGSNITIGNNTIQSNNTNGNIILKPNGTGIVQANASIIPNADGVRDLGSSTQAWRRAYIDELLPEDLTVSGDAVINGNLTVQGDTIQIGNITTDTLTIQLANTAANAAAANGAGITVGANDNIATILYNSTANRWNVSVGMSAVGNISAPYFSGNGSLLTGITSYGNANVANYLPTYNGNISAGNIDVADTVTIINDLYVTTGSFSGDATGTNAIYAGVPLFTVLGSDVVAQFSGNINSYTQFNFQNGNSGPLASGDYVITANNGDDNTFFFNMGLTSNNHSDPDFFGDSSTPNDAYMYVVGADATGPGNTGPGNLIIGSTNGVIKFFVGNTAQANVVQTISSSSVTVTGNTTAGNVLTGGMVSATGNITGNYILGNGSQLTSINAVTVDVTDTNGLTTVYYPTFVENRTTTQIARADVDLTYRTDDNLLTVGNVSVTGNITGNTAGFAIGFRDIPQVSFTGNATIATADAGKHFYSTQSTDYILTIANNTSQGFQTGAAITVINQGTGNITLAQGSGVTLYLTGNATSGNRTVTTFGMATLIKVATDTWFVSGAGVI